MTALVAGTFACASSCADAQPRRAASSAPAARSVPDRPLTLAERQAAWSEHKAEYRRRLLRDGRAGADRWLDAQALAARGTPSSAPAAKPPQEAAAPRATADAPDTRNCRKIRWVNRATPGFGGSGMTMSRVPVCAD